MRDILIKLAGKFGVRECLLALGDFNYENEVNE